MLLIFSIQNSLFPIFTAQNTMLTDIEIAQQAQLKRIETIATENNINPDILEQYGKYKAKIDFTPNQDRSKQHRQKGQRGIA